jgi:hypothetical protein
VANDKTSNCSRCLHPDSLLGQAGDTDPISLLPHISSVCCSQTLASFPFFDLIFINRLPVLVTFRLHQLHFVPPYITFSPPSHSGSLLFSLRSLILTFDFCIYRHCLHLFYRPLADLRSSLTALVATSCSTHRLELLTVSPVLPLYNIRYFY